MFYKIQQGLVGISLPSEVCSLTRASQAPNVFPSVIFNPERLLNSTGKRYL